MTQGIPDYGYGHAGPTWDNRYLTDVMLDAMRRRLPAGARVFELGCGNGHVAGLLESAGYRVTGVDPSASGIAAARIAHPKASFEQARVEDDLAARFGTFDCVVSLDVIEHCYSAVEYTRKARALLAPGGLGIISTPYHGYWKNLALAATGRMAAHLDPLWEGGHIKFFTVPAFRSVLAVAGFIDIDIQRLGRWPRALAKSMLALASAPTGARC